MKRTPVQLCLRGVALLSSLAIPALGQSLHSAATLDTPVAVQRAFLCGEGAEAIGIGSDGALYGWKLPSPQARKIVALEGSPRKFDCAARNTLAVLQPNGVVLILDAESGAVRQKIETRQRVQNLSLSPDGSLLLISTNLSPTQLWDAQTAKLISTSATNLGASWANAFSPTGRFYVSADEDTRIRAYDQKGKLLYEADGGLLEPFAVTFSGDGKQFAVAGGDGAVRLFDAASGKILKTAPGTGNPIVALQMSPNGERVLALEVDDFRLAPLGFSLWEVREAASKPLALDHIESIVGAGRSKSQLLLLRRKSENHLTLSSLE